MVALPAYNGWTGSFSFPSNLPSGSTATFKDSQNNFDTPGMTGVGAAYTARSKDFYLSFSVNPTTDFGSGLGTIMSPFTLTSPCIVNGTTYYFDEFAVGAFQNESNAVASGTSVTLNFAYVLNPQAGGVTVDFVVSH